jgi:ABC-type spermidine/putrescine transport system permease subunit II
VTRRDCTRPLLLGWSALVGAFLYVPLAVVAIYSFNDGRFLLQWTGFGAEGYRQALANRSIQRALVTSLVVAAASALVSVLVGGMAGLGLARRPGVWARPLGALLLLILVAPEIVMGIAYLIFFVAIGLDAGLVRLVLSHAILGSAVVTLVVRARLSGIDEQLEEAAADLGARPLGVFLDVTLPLMWPALLAGGLLAFTFSLDDVVTSAFVSTAGDVTLPVYIFSALRTGLKTEHAAMVTLTLVATLAGLACAWLALRRGTGPRGVIESLAGH